ncbi:diguanylate cyclase [Halobacillus locisalis]|uniref:Diguanylate cyclase n=1 Tax=Halobacillus locisalis TaxID=220753 RepID=A0A838CPJ1_9BACI|nr:GGDEF domain-containing protein [Halobacillus locisalis]MBA2173778.1 diguanylate cyclase [Halobacillus locisalis]
MKLNYLFVMMAFYIGLGIIIGMLFSLVLPLWITVPEQAMPWFSFGFVLAGIVLGLGNYLIFSMFVKRFIKHFQCVLRSVRNGDLSARSRLKSSGVLAELKQSVNMTLEDLEKTQQTMQRDELTKLPNRLSLQQFFHNRERIIGTSYAFYFLDMNDFKSINDTYGHLMGDNVLRHVADSIRKAIGKENHLYRLSGDEFVILHQTSTYLDDDIRMMCQKITEPFNKSITIEDIPLNINLSIGVYHFKYGHEDLETIMDKADQAMYEAKTNNHKKYVVFQGESSTIKHLSSSS